MTKARYLRDGFLFVPCYVALDWASFIHPLGPFNITPWSPQAALAIVWMFLGGLHYMPVCVLAIYVADFLVRDTPAGYLISLLGSVVLTLGYAGISAALRISKVSPDLSTTSELSRFVGISVSGTALNGLLFISLLQLSGLLLQGAFAEAWLRFWMGDLVGVLVTAPVLLVASAPQRREAFKTMAMRPVTVIQLAALVGALWVIFHGLGAPSEYFYFLFLPLIWITAENGLIGAIFSIAIVQLGVVVGIYDEGTSSLAMLHLQALVAALTLTGLLLGIMVDERQRATESMKEALRLAAAGEMAGAITHEINQPLTALSNYGRSAQMQIERGDASGASETLRKMLAESERAAEVVRRLRDFFRAGTTRLEMVPVAELLDTARAMGRKLIGSASIDLEVRAEPDLRPLLVDRLQIEIVLRNLLANAVEALPSHGTHGGGIRVTARRHGDDHMCIVVQDSGTGVPPMHQYRVFEPFVSGKSTGMGLGLTISRAIARAHGGDLEVGEAPHGEFHLILPHTAGHVD